MVNVIIEEPAFTIRITGGIGAQGSKGDPGNGIASAVLNDDYTLTLNFTDGTSYTTEPIRGAQGETGNGISSAVLNPDYTLTLYFTDGTHYTTTSIRGAQGEKGVKGDPGFSPIATVSKSGTVTTLTVTDEDGTTTAEILDGAPGAKGDTGASGVYVGESAPTDPTVNVWVDTDGDPDAVVTDVKVNGTSVVDAQGAANIPFASSNDYGVSRADSSLGIGISGGALYISRAYTNNMKSGASTYLPIVPSNQHISAFYALAKLAGADMASTTGDVIGVYPEAQKIAIQKMLGVYEAPYRLITERTITEETSAISILADDNNDSFELTEAIILFEEVLGTGNGHASIMIHPDGANATTPNLCVYNMYNNTTAQTRAAYISVRGGRFMGYAVDASYSNFYTPSPLRANKNAFGFIEAGKIIRIRISSLNAYKLTSGKITVYGR